VVENLNAMLKVEGHALIVTQCNGDPTHGFYQLSPEFFYSALSPANGFTDTRVFLFDVDRDRYHAAPRPNGFRQSIPDGRWDIACVARKAASAPEVIAQQSDYDGAWSGHALKRPAKAKIRDWRYKIHNKSYGRFLMEFPRFEPETLQQTLQP